VVHPTASLRPRPQGRDQTEGAGGLSPQGRRRTNPASAGLTGLASTASSPLKRHERVRTARITSSCWPSGHHARGSGFAQSTERFPPSPADGADSPHLPGAASASTPGRPASVDTHRRDGRVTSPAGASAPGALRCSHSERRLEASAAGRAQVGPLHGRTVRPLQLTDSGSRRRRRSQDPVGNDGRSSRAP
jgi:hypothetical protein